MSMARINSGKVLLVVAWLTGLWAGCESGASSPQTADSGERDKGVEIRLEAGADSGSRDLAVQDLADSGARDSRDR